MRGGAIGSVVAGYLLILLFGAGLGGWAVLTPIAGAILAPGVLAPDSGQRAIQHPEGGRIAEVRVTEGAVVAQGALLARLDGGEIASELARLEVRLVQTATETARLRAERDDADRITFAPDGGGAGATAQRDAQIRLFDERRAAFRAELDQIGRRIDQIGDQIAGLGASLAASRRQIALLGAATEREADLVARGLLPRARAEETERELARLEGQLGSQQAARAEAESRIAEAGLETLRLQAARRESAAADLRAILAEAADLRAQRDGLRMRLDALDLRAPVAGTVRGLRSAATVLRPGEPALFLIPHGGPLVVETRIALADRDALRVGQPVRLRLAAFDLRRQSDIPARLTLISAAPLPDAEGQGVHYAARIEIAPGDIDPGTADRLVAGMPVEVMILTRNRTALSYLTEPLTSYFRRAFREG